MDFQENDLWKTLRAISTVIDTHEMYIKDHAINVANYATKIGKIIGLTDKELENLQYAVLLHDIGQIKINQNLLSKPGKLTKAEYMEIKFHPIEGERIIKMMPNLELTAQWVRWHHEWWDGTGYPDKLKANKIPLPSRILSVADSFDAMRADRPYRPSMSIEEAFSELKLMAGIQFDPMVVKILGTLLENEKII